MAHHSLLGPDRRERQGNPPPQLERFEYRRAHSHTVEVNASRVAMISHPGLVTRLIEDAARATR